MQHCHNCKSVSSTCTQYVGVIVLWDICEKYCVNEPTCNMGVYYPSVDGCYRYTCSEVEEDKAGVGYHALRKTCNQSGKDSDIITNRRHTQARYMQKRTKPIKCILMFK